MYEDYEDEDLIRYCAEEERNDLLEFCNPAEPSDYVAWLKGYMSRGGKVTQRYPYNISSLYILESNPGYIPPLYGANAVNLIIPESVEFSPANVLKPFHGRNGHNNIYFMDRFIAVTDHIPIFKDTVL